MVIVGTWLFGSYSAGKAFMLIEAFTVFLALIGTTLSCMNTGARVTYAMGRDEEVPSHFGLLHGKTLSPHRAIWTLSILSIFIGILTTTVYLGAQGTDLAPLDKHNFWYSFGIFSPHAYTWLPNSLVIITLISNFGTFLLYMTTCIVAIVAFKEHHIVQRDQAHGHPGVRSAGEPVLHAVLSGRAVHGQRHELARALHRARRCRPVGPLWGVLLHEVQQGQRPGSVADQQAG